MPQPNERDPSRSPARSAGLFRPPFAAAQRDPTSKANSRSGFCGQDGRALLLPGSLSAAARTRRKSPQGRAHGCARVRCRHRDVPSANLRSVLAKSPAWSRRPQPRGCVLFGYFLLHKHCAAGAARTAKPARRAEGRMPGVTESDSPARMAGEAHRDVSRVSWRRQTNQKKKQMDSGFRRNDGNGGLSSE